MMKNDEIYSLIVEAIGSYDKNLQLMILSSSKNDNYKQIAHKYGIKLIYEAFADIDTILQRVKELNEFVSLWQKTLFRS